jgi:hypothetical protein
MKYTLEVCTAAIVLLWPHPFLGQPPKSRLPPTESASRTVRAIQSKLAVDLNRETFESDKARHKRQFEQLKNTITSFVIAQLEAKPEIEWWQLRAQLILVLGTKYDEQTPDHFHEPPYVFQAMQSGKEGPIVWALAYKEDAFYGFGGSRVIVESYVVENGKARLAGRGGAEMDGHDLKAERIWNPLANSTSILTHGILQWSSGHALPAAAVLYSVSPEGVKTIWKLAAPGLRLLGNDGMLFAIEYHDEHRHTENLPSLTVDVYSVDRNSAIPYRVVHQIPVSRKQ